MPSQNSLNSITVSPAPPIEAATVNDQGGDDLDPISSHLQAESEPARAPMKPLLSLRKQLIQLNLVYHGLKIGAPLIDVIHILKTQKDLALSQGWSTVKLLNDSRLSQSEITDIFTQTHFFHDDVLILFEMGEKLGESDLQSTLASAIDFLKDMIRDEEQWNISANSMAGVRAHSDRLNVSLIEPHGKAY